MPNRSLCVDSTELHQVTTTHIFRSCLAQTAGCVTTTSKRYAWHSLAHFLKLQASSGAEAIHDAAPHPNWSLLCTTLAILDRFSCQRRFAFIILTGVLVRVRVRVRVWPTQLQPFTAATWAPIAVGVEGGVSEASGAYQRGMTVSYNQPEFPVGGQSVYFAAACIG